MTDVTDDKLESPPAALLAKVEVPTEPPHIRRKFFARALGEILSPFAGLIEARINPILHALDQLPSEVDRGTAALGLPKPTRPPTHLPIAPPRLLRPPGALPEPEFQALCSRCGICVSACPAQCIKLDGTGQIGDGHPYIIAAESPCVICEPLACMNHCPTGALKLVEKLDINMGLAKVDHNSCLRHHGDDCKICHDACPIGEDAITISAESGRVRIKQDGCIGCGICESSCPTEPRSIFVVPAKPPVEPIVA